VTGWFVLKSQIIAVILTAIISPSIPSPAVAVRTSLIHTHVCRPSERCQSPGFK